MEQHSAHWANQCQATCLQWGLLMMLTTMQATFMSDKQPLPDMLAQRMQFDAQLELPKCS